MRTSHLAVEQETVENTASVTQGRTSDSGVTPTRFDESGPGGNLRCDFADLNFDSNVKDTNRDSSQGGNDFKDPGWAVDWDDIPAITSVTVMTLDGADEVEFVVAPGFTVLGAIVKGGPVSNFYDYRADGTSGDSGLTAPINNDKPYGLSNLRFCYLEDGTQQVVPSKSWEGFDSAEATPEGWADIELLLDGERVAIWRFDTDGAIVPPDPEGPTAEYEDGSVPFPLDKTPQFREVDYDVDGWACEQDREVVATAADADPSMITNVCEREEPTPEIVFAKIVCDDYSQIPQNESSSILGVGGYDLTYGGWMESDTDWTSNVNGYLDVDAEIAAAVDRGCSLEPDFTFDLFDGENAEKIASVTTDGDGIATLPIEDEVADVFEAGDLFVAEAFDQLRIDTSDNIDPYYSDGANDGQYQFGSLRCGNDGANLDNRESLISGNDDQPLGCVGYNVERPSIEVEKTVSGPVDDGTEFQVCWSSADRYLGDRFDESMLSIAEVSFDLPIMTEPDCVTFRYDDGTVSVVEGSASSMLEPGTYWVAEEDTGGADSVSISITPSDLERTAEDLEFPLEDDETPVAFFEVGYGDVVTVEVENSFTPVTTSTPRYFLDFDKSWTIDDLSDRVSDLETDGYNASFDVITDADGEETVEVEVDDVTLSAGGQSIAAGNDRRVSLNNDYVLEESFTALDEDLLCTIESTFSYDGEVLEANDDGEVIFTTPASASNNTTFTIDVENEIVCTAVLGEVFESIDIEAVKEWVSVGDDGEQTSIAGPADFTASFAVTVTDEDGEVMATATINGGQVEPFDEEFVDGETYTITWAEIAPPAEFENDGVTLQFNDDASTTAGSVDFVAGDDDSVTLTATNAYDPQPEDPQVDTDTTTTEVEVLGVSVTQDDEEMPKTGASALFLTVLGLLGIGLGGGMLGRFRRTES